MAGVADPFQQFAENYAPESGSRYVAVTLVTENPGTTAFEVRPSDFTLQDAMGYLWRSTSIQLAEGYAVPVLQNVQIAPGDRLTGLVVFQIPADVAVGALHYQPESSRLLTVSDALGGEVAAPTGQGSLVTVEDPDTGTQGVFTVTEIQDPYEGFEEGSEPEAGARYVLVTLAVENTGGAPLDVSSSDLLVRDADGYLWRSVFIRRDDASAVPDLQSQSLAPGSRISGVVGFEIPADAPLADVIYQPTSGRIIVLAEVQPGI